MSTTKFPATLTETLLHSSAGDRSVTFINGRTEQHSVRYSDLRQRALGLLHSLQSAGLQQGSELIILSNDNEQFIIAFWAALLGGIIPVPLTATGNNSARQKVLSVFRKLDNPYLWTSAETLDRLCQHAEDNDQSHLGPLLRSKALLIGQISPGRQLGAPAEVKPDDITFVQFSSGSTGTPKGVILTHRNLLSNIRSIIAGAELTRSDVTLSWMPLTHDMGIIGFHLVPLVLDIDACLMPSELFVRRPMLWLEKVSETQATATSSPNFGYQHLLKYFPEEPQDTLDLSSLRLIFNGAEPISAAIYRRFNATLKPWHLPENAIFPVYGLAEASLAAAFTRPGAPLSTVFVRRHSLHIGQEVMALPDAAADTVEMVHLGQPVPDTEIRIVDARGIPLPDNHLGHVHIRGDNVTAGYYHDPDLTAETITPDHWLKTGDLGFINQGQLVISGRHKELIIINGQNYHPHDLDLLCSALPDIGPGKAVACAVSGDAGEQLAVFVMYRGSLQDFLPVVGEIRKTLAQNAGIDAAHVIPVSSFPKTTSGKVQRYVLAEQYAQGEYAEILQQLEELTRPAAEEQHAGSNTEQLLQDICHAVLDNRDIGLHDDLFELGASSLELTQIHERIEQQFPGRVELTDLFEYPTIAELAAFLDQQQQS